MKRVEKSNQNSGIKAWSSADRPREKLRQQGRRTLSDAELLAIIISSGNKLETAVDISKKILGFCSHDLSRLAKMSVKELSAFRGIGEAKAAFIVAALELGRRRKYHESGQAPTHIRTAKAAYEIFRTQLIDLNHEEFWMLLLNNAHRMIACTQVSSGGRSMTIVDPKIVFKIALEHHATAIIVAHNHPSGNLSASQQDISLTKKLVYAGKLLELPVLDHLIVSESGYLSMADEGLLDC